MCSSLLVIIGHMRTKEKILPCTTISKTISIHRNQCLLTCFLKFGFHVSMIFLVDAGLRECLIT